MNIPSFPGPFCWVYKLSSILLYKDSSAALSNWCKIPAILYSQGVYSPLFRQAGLEDIIYKITTNTDMAVGREVGLWEERVGRPTLPLAFVFECLICMGGMG